MIEADNYNTSKVRMHMVGKVRMHMVGSTEESTIHAIIKTIDVKKNPSSYSH